MFLLFESLLSRKVKAETQFSVLTGTYFPTRRDCSNPAKQSVLFSWHDRTHSSLTLSWLVFRFRSEYRRRASQSPRQLCPHTTLGSQRCTPNHAVRKQTYPCHAELELSFNDRPRFNFARILLSRRCSYATNVVSLEPPTTANESDDNYP